MKKKTGVKKANICHKCGEPPEDGKIYKHRGEWKCSECMLDPTSSADIEAAYDDMTRHGVSCSLGAVEDLLPPPITISIEDSDKINHMARECKVDISQREWSQGVRK